MRFLMILALVVAPGALAAPFPCGFEPTPRSRTQCLRVLVRSERARLEAEIAEAGAGLQPATGRQIRRYEAALRAEHRRWRAGADRTCRAGATDPVAVEICRLEATRARRMAVRGALDRARARLGSAPPIPLPADVEVLIPLPDPPAGPAAGLRLPLAIPLPTE